MSRRRNSAVIRKDEIRRANRLFKPSERNRPAERRAGLGSPYDRRVPQHVTWRSNATTHAGDCARNREALDLVPGARSGDRSTTPAPEAHSSGCPRAARRCGRSRARGRQRRHVPHHDSPTGVPRRSSRRPRYDRKRVLAARGISGRRPRSRTTRHRFVVRPRRGVFAETPSVHPAVRSFEHVSRVWLADDAFPGAELPYVHEVGDVFGNLLEPVALVCLGFEIDLALRSPQRVEVALEIVDARVGGDDQIHDEGGVALPEPELLEDVVLRSPRRSRL